MPFKSFPSIVTFSTINARETFKDTPRRTVARRGKVKLHGANMRILVETDGTVISGSKNQVITRQQDLCGFAEWLHPHLDVWRQAQRTDLPVEFCGEWCGPDTAKSVGGRDAVMDIPERTFFIFMIRIGDWVITDPEAIAGRLPGFQQNPEAGANVRVIPWVTPARQFDFSDLTQVQGQLDQIEDEVMSLEARDPYIAKEFGIEGFGEGIVYMPAISRPFEMTTEEFVNSTWKAKGPRHRVKKSPKAASIREPLPADAIEFVETFCTEQRMIQGMQEACGGMADLKLTGKLMHWILGDIQKEGAVEIAGMAEQGIEWRRLQSEITPVVRDWYTVQCQGLAPAPVA
jgi:hypothetical protein